MWIGNAYLKIMITRDQSHLTNRPHRRHTWTVQWYSPCCVSVHPTQYMLPWANTSQQPKRHVDWFSRFCTANCRASWYFTMSRPFPWKICTPTQYMIPWAWPQPKRYLDRFSHFCRAY